MTWWRTRTTLLLLLACASPALAQTGSPALRALWVDAFHGWMAWEKRHAHGRQLAVGLGAYRNTA